MNKRIKLYIGALMLLMLIFLFGVTLYAHSPFKPSGKSLEAPSIQHILGTDDLGIDIFAQISYGYFSSIFMGICVCLTAFAVGGIAGIGAGFIKSADMGISFLINIFLSVPQLPIIILGGFFFGSSLLNVVIIIAMFSWAPVAKIMRAKTLEIKNSDYVKMVKSYGGGFWYILRNHMAKALTPLLLINSVNILSKAIVMEATLSFFGLGNPVNKSWGMMISRAMGFKGIYMLPFWKWWLLPCVICLILVVFLLRMMIREYESTVNA